MRIVEMMDLKNHKSAIYHRCLLYSASEFLLRFHNRKKEEKYTKRVICRRALSILGSWGRVKTDILIWRDSSVTAIYQLRAKLCLMDGIVVRYLRSLTYSISIKKDGIRSKYEIYMYPWIPRE
jgi:hypothetical protein